MSISAGPKITTDNLVLSIDASNSGKSSSLNTVEVLVVAGGGGGGGEHGGGGGAGGLMYTSANVAPGTGYPIVVGAGGTSGGYARPANPTTGGKGGNSSAFGLTAIGGGGGGGRSYLGASGGSGGGSGSRGTSAGGAGTSNQGYAGGIGTAESPQYCGGGGGGAGELGTSAYNEGPVAGDGGAGLYFGHMFGTSVGENGWFAGGGGGCAFYSATGYGLGGIGGGGRGATNSATPLNGTANTGGGGGGANRYATGGKHTATSIGPAGAGGSGVVIIRYYGPQKAVGGTVTSFNGNTIHIFTSSGTFTPLLMEDGTTPSIISDISNNARNIIPSGVVYSNDGTFTFDGVDDYINLGDIARLNTGGTISCWYYANTSGEGPYGRIVDKSSGLDAQNGYHFYMNSSSYLNAQINGAAAIATPTLPTLKEWHHAVLVMDSTKKEIWIDGAKVANNTNTTLPPDIAGNVFIGNRADNTDRSFNGKISQIQIYNRALSADEVKSNFNATKDRFLPRLYYAENSRADMYLENWDNKTITTMEQMGNLGYTTAHGYTSGPETYILSLSSLPSHTKIRYKLYWHCVDSLDTETSTLDITNDSGTYENIITFTKASSSIPTIISTATGTTTAWTGNQYYSYAPWNGNPDGYAAGYGYITIDSGYREHTASTIQVKHVIGANQLHTDEAMYLSHVELWLAP